LDFQQPAYPAFRGRDLEVRELFQICQLSGNGGGAVAVHFNLSPAEEAAVDRLLANTARNFAVLFVGTRWESKQWFPLQMSQCAEQLRRLSLGVVLLGGKNDVVLARDVEKLFSGKFTNLVGLTTLREAIGIIQRAKIAVGPDTGLMHIAAALRTPVVSLWGATSPQRTGPYGFAHLALQGRAPCVPCLRRTCPIGRVCLQSITADQISEKIRAAMKDAERAKANYAG
jgi:ADP-heptose:LPS heptosyltransferase